MRAGLIGTALTLALQPSAPGADLSPPPEPAAVPIGRALYLRADVMQNDLLRPTDASLSDPKAPGLLPLVRSTLGNEPGYAGGVGYRVPPWLRLDAPLDQRRAADYRAYASRSTFATDYSVEAGHLGVLTGLVNVYADLGTWWGLTPYLGAGFGFVQKDFHRGSAQATCLIDACDGTRGRGARTAVTRPIDR